MKICRARVFIIIQSIIVSIVCGMPSHLGRFITRIESICWDIFHLIRCIIDTVITKQEERDAANKYVPSKSQVLIGRPFSESIPSNNPCLRPAILMEGCQKRMALLVQISRLLNHCTMHCLSRDFADTIDHSAEEQTS